MLQLKAVSNTATERILVCAWRSRYADRDIPIRIAFNADRVTLQPNLDAMEWLLNVDRADIMEQIRDMVEDWKG